MTSAKDAADTRT